MKKTILTRVRKTRSTQTGGSASSSASSGTIGNGGRGRRWPEEAGDRGGDRVARGIAGERAREDEGGSVGAGGWCSRPNRLVRSNRDRYRPVDPKCQSF